MTNFAVKCSNLLKPKPLPLCKKGKGAILREDKPS
jgi:hypothetical protein